MRKKRVDNDRKWEERKKMQEEEEIIPIISMHY